MTNKAFRVENREWTKRHFPVRLLEAARERHGFTPNDDFGINQKIADACGVDKSMVTRWLDGAVPRAATVLRIAEAYNVDPDYLVGNDTLPAEGYSFDDLDTRLPFETIQNVIRLMYEAQASLDKKPTTEEFSQAAIEVLRLVEREPNLPEYAISGAALHSLKHGPGSV